MAIDYTSTRIDLAVAGMTCAAGAARIEAQLENFETAPALEQAEAVVIQSTNIFGADENFYRAAPGRPLD